ncbi:MAG: flavodoxin domain-containing protein [Saccharofermentans sp.]|nr:flavodoxin domain-containing protein [Saccharofermentans sp.]
MTGIIVYKSKYGATEKYAKWLSEETGYPCVPVKEADINEVARNDIIIVGGGVYASGITCIPFLKKNLNRLKGKKIIVYTCAASPYDKKFFDALIEMNMKDDLKDIPVFYCRGAFDLKNMSFADRTLCRMLRKAVAKKEPKDRELWEGALMECKEDEACDWTDRSYIKPILEAVQNAGL